MRRLFIAFLVMMIVLPVMAKNPEDLKGAQNPEKALTLETERQKTGYSVGYNLGLGVRSISQEVDLEAVFQGFKDATFQGVPKIPEPEMKKIFSEFQKKVSEKRQAQFGKMAEKNRTEGERFLKENAGKEGIIVTKSGLQYQVLKEGTGPIPKDTDIVKAHYRATLIDGTEIIDTYKRGQPAILPLQRVIPAWAEGFQLMKGGSRYKFFVPSKLAYGERGSPPLVGPNAVLIYEVELLEIE